MKRHHLYITALLSAVLLTACNDKVSLSDYYVPSAQPHYLSLSNSSFTFGAKTHLEQSLTVGSLQSPWSFQGYDQSWLSLSPSSGSSEQTVTMSATENLSPTLMRTSVFQFVSTDASYGFSRTLSVTQEKAEPYLETTQSEVEFGAAQGQATIAVDANFSWKASVDSYVDWLSVEASVDQKSLTLSVAENLSDQSRSGYVVLSSAEEGIATTLTVYVFQRAADAPTADQPTLSFEHIGGTQRLVISSEHAWRATTPQSWIDVTPVEGAAGTTDVLVSVAANTSATSRTGYINIYIGETSRLTINIAQAGIQLSSETTALSFTAAAQQQQLVISSNAEWRVAERPEWLIVSDDEGSGDATLTLSVPDYWDTAERSGSLRIVATANEQVGFTVNVAQKGRIVGDVISELHFEVGGGEKTISIDTDGQWTAHATATWLTVSPAQGQGNGTLTVTAQPNDTDDERTTQVMVEVGSITKTIAVSQPGRYFTVTPTAGATLPSVGGSHVVAIGSNGPWTATSSSDWMQLSSISGDGDISVTLTAPDNPSIHERTDTTTFAPLYLQPVRVVTTQAGRYLRLSTTTLSFFAKGGTSEPVTVATDGTYTVTPVAAWLTVQQTDNGFTVTATENTDGSDREGKIVVALSGLNDGESYAVELTVGQRAVSPGISVEGFGDDQSWEIVVGGGMTITVTGFSEDKKWD